MPNTILTNISKLKKNDFIYFSNRISRINWIVEYNSNNFLMNYSYNDIITSLAINKTSKLLKIKS